MKAKILRERSWLLLETEINKKLNDGYTLSGGITVDGVFYVAVVVKPF